MARTPTRKSDLPPTLRIITLAAPRISIDDDEALGPIGPGKPLALVTFLAFAPRRTASRDQLCDLLWGDRDTEQARAQLRQTLWLIKRSGLGIQIDSRPDGLVLVNPVEVDAVNFAAAVESGQLEAALELYTGDFLADYAAPGAGRFEMWAELERARLRSLLLHAADSMTRRSLESGQYQAAVRTARRLREVDPNSEMGWRLLLEAHSASGDRLAALVEADHFEAWLKQERREPEPGSILALQTARQEGEERKDKAHQTLIAELVGRDKEFAAFNQAWFEIVRRGTIQFHITAESGIGKTRLVTDFVARIQSGGGTAVYQRAHLGERFIPYCFVASIAESLAALPGARGVSQGSVECLMALNPSLSHLFPGVHQSRASLEPRSVGFALLELLSALADESPIALALDDLHWVDGNSQDALALLLTRLDSQQVLILTTARSKYGVATLPPSTRTIVLEPLDTERMKQMIASIAALPDARWATRLPSLLVEASRGNPLFAMEALRACLDSGILSRREGIWYCQREDALASQLGREVVMQRRLGELPAQQSAVLLTLAIAAIPLPSAILSQASDVAIRELDLALAHLEARGLAIVSGGTARIAHDEMTTSLLQLAGDLATTTHAALGAAMAAADDDWKRRAIPHLAHARNWREAARVIRPLVGRERSPGVLDHRLRALLGDASSADSLNAVRRELPMAVRHPWARRAMAVAGVVAVIAMGVVYASAGSPTNAAAVHLGIQNKGSAASVYSIALSTKNWRAEDALTPARLALPARWRNFNSAFANHHSPRPGRVEWSTHKVAADSGEGEVVLTAPDSERRLTFERGQDRPIAFSPDGKVLAFATTRWSDRGYSSVALMNLSLGTVRRLTSDSMTYSLGAWSPDGTRLVLVADQPQQGTSRMCIIDVAGVIHRCRPIDGERHERLVGWVSDIEILMHTDVASTFENRLTNVDTWATRAVTMHHFEAAVTDPSGKWLLGATQVSDSVRYWVAPTNRLDAVRELVAPDQERFVPMFTSSATSYLDRIAIVPRLAPVVQNVPHRLSAAGWSADGAGKVPHALRWSVADSSRATIDSLGVLIARDTGVHVITVTAGGWRMAGDTVRVVPAESRVLLDGVSLGLSQRGWIPFGNPQPLMDSEEAGGTVLINGDDSFFSGMYAMMPTDMTRGIALDLEVSTPINAIQWQLLIAMFVATRDTAGIRQWDRRTGYIPVGGTGCGATYPTGEGIQATRFFGPINDIPRAMGDARFSMRDGRWWRLRVQWLPDGRCAVAINGRPLYITSFASYANRFPLIAIVEGMSVGTKVRVRNVKVMSGVPSDMDWSVLPSVGGDWMRR